MPIYEYACAECKKVSEFIQKMSDPTPEECPACGAKQTLSKQISHTAFVLKGGGWYSDAYSSKAGSSKSSNSSDSSSSSSGSSESKTETKSESKPAHTHGKSCGSGGCG